MVSIKYDPSDFEATALRGNPYRSGASAARGGAIAKTYFNAFYESLLAWAEAFNNRVAEVELYVILPEDFPRAPPEVRMLRPILETGTGGVVNGFFVGVPELFPRGWAPGTTLARVFGWLRASLPARGALVDARSAAFYSIQAYAATRGRVVGATAPAPAHKSDFSQLYYVFSSPFAERFMAAVCPAGFDAGGKALFPTAALERVMRTELRDGLAAGADGGGAGLGGGSALLGAAVTAAGLAGRGGGAASSALTEQLLSVNADDAMTSEAAMVFELHSPLGFSTFVGVREFTSPEPDMIIVPPEMLANLGIAEGTQLRVTRADLPQLTSLVLQPHSTAFLDVEATTGCPPREFLEESFNNFSAFAPGETLLCSGGTEHCGMSDVDMLYDSDDPANAHKSAVALRVRPPDGAYRFTIISIEPANAPAAQLFRGFAASINIEFLCVAVLRASGRACVTPAPSAPLTRRTPPALSPSGPLKTRSNSPRARHWKGSTSVGTGASSTTTRPAAPRAASAAACSPLQLLHGAAAAAAAVACSRRRRSSPFAPHAASAVARSRTTPRRRSRQRSRARVRAAAALGGACCRLRLGGGGRGSGLVRSVAVPQSEGAGRSRVLKDSAEAEAQVRRFRVRGLDSRMVGRLRNPQPGALPAALQGALPGAPSTGRWLLRRQKSWALKNGGGARRKLR
jgi:hypothetical protein